MPRAFSSDRTWQFGVGVDDLWRRLTAVDDYRSWWPWLRRFEADDGFRTSARWRCVVAPPLPYVVRFGVVLDEVDEGRLVRARVEGDIHGEAELSVGGSSAGSSARLTSRLAPADPILRRVALLAPPLVQWGHDWVLDQGRRQFVDRALTEA